MSIVLPVKSEIPLWIDRSQARETITDWYFIGIDPEKLPPLRSDVNHKPTVLWSIKCLLQDPTYEHNRKIAGCAYLLWQFFDYGDAPVEVVKPVETLEELHNRWRNEWTKSAHLDVPVMSLVEAPDVDYTDRVNYIRVSYRKGPDIFTPTHNAQLYEQMYIFSRSISHKIYATEHFSALRTNMGSTRLFEIVSAGLVKDSTCYGGAASLRMYTKDDRYGMGDTKMFQSLKKIMPCNSTDADQS